jgi:hypothetical protein
MTRLVGVVRQWPRTTAWIAFTVALAVAVDVIT